MITHALFAIALHLAPCTIAGAKARCGTFDVPESQGSKRTLHLKVVVLPATERNESPAFFFSGGPGEPATPAAPFFVKEFAADRRLHDIVLLDERGTAGSGELACPKAMKAHAREMIEGDLFPVDLVTDCRKEIEPHADLTHYTFDDFSSDVESLRTVLGYGPINIVALSYGTRAALTYEAKYPKSVRTMLLYGPLPPENRPPLEMARDAQAAMDHIAEPRTVRGVLALLPVEIKSAGYDIHMTRGMFSEYLRSMLYTIDQQKKVPDILQKAAAGDWKGIAPGFIEYRKHFYGNMPVFLSVTCPTDVRAIETLEIGPATVRSFGLDYRVLRQIAACQAWAPGVVPRLTVSKENIPILIIVGDRDPVTPKRWADVLANDAPLVHTVVMKNYAHADITACDAALEAAFLDAGSFDKLDESCAQTP